MVNIHISSESDVTDWAVLGNGEQCRQQLSMLEKDMGVEWMSASFLNLPKDLAGRQQFLMRFGEEVIKPMTPSVPRAKR